VVTERSREEGENEKTKAAGGENPFLGDPFKVFREGKGGFVG